MIVAHRLESASLACWCIFAKAQAVLFIVDKKVEIGEKILTQNATDAWSLELDLVQLFDYRTQL
jgi:hypothetical protein